MAGGASTRRAGIGRACLGCEISPPGAGKRMIMAAAQTRKSAGVSFEFFPPATEKMERTLWRSIERLAPVAPQFVSVTYGAGGSTRARTHAVIERILRETSLKPAAHLTCVGATCGEVDEVVREYKDAGVRHIVALRGDPPDGLDGTYQSHPGGYASTAGLIEGIRAIGEFEISVSAYPEKHPESATFDVDLDVLQAKIDAGATRAITQFFFDNDVFYHYLDRVRARGLDIPIVPGLIPIGNFERICSFAAKCGASIPADLTARFAGLEDEPDIRRLVAAAVAAEQVNALRAQGIEEFHFYTMNRAELVYAICRILGLADKVGDR
jgi:methylenetetrahydrofolate reductase (NADPH)